MIVQAAPLKRHHQSEKSRQRASLAAIRSRPSIRRRGDIFDELSVSARKTNDGNSSNRRARKIRDDSPPFSAPATETEREREIGFLLSSPRNFNSWTRVQSFPPPLFSVRIRSYRFHAFNIADSPRSCESIPLVFFRACICKGRYLSRFWLERSFLFVLETSVLWNFFRTEKRERAKFNLILSICLLRVKIWNRKIRRIM